jgi:clan AA aspartic protease
MGLIRVTVTLRASEKSRRTYQADFLVDTGATDCMAPGTKLRRAGIRRRGRMAYELADGTTVEYDFGLAEIEFMGELTSGRILFGPDACEPILGVTALESVGITVEPSTQQLKRLPAIPLKQLLHGDKRGQPRFVQRLLAVKTSFGATTTSPRFGGLGSLSVREGARFNRK